MKILDRYRKTEVTADLLWPGDEFGQRVVKEVRPFNRNNVQVFFEDGSDTIYRKNTLFIIKRRNFG